MRTSCGTVRLCGCAREGACCVQRAARHIFMSSCTVASVNLRPMRRFVSYTVFSGLSAACGEGEGRGQGQGEGLW